MRPTCLALLLIGLNVPATAAEPELSAGVATVDITPPRGYRMAGYFHERINTGTRDPLQAKALVFRQGDRQAALVFCDLVAIPRNVAHEARALASAKTGIPAAHIAVAATHSHTGPLYYGLLRDEFHSAAVKKHGRDPQEEVDYPAELVRKVAEVVVEAQTAAGPVRLATGTAPAEKLSFNRRFHMKDGTVRFNPGVLNPELVRVAGPIDPEVGLVMVQPLQAGPPIAGLTVFALHLDTVGGAEYSADYPGVLATELRKHFGPRFVSLFGAGTCGDINHVDVTTRDRLKTETIGQKLAEIVEAAASDLTPVAKPGLAVADAVIAVPVRTPSAADVADATAKIGLVGDPKLPFLDAVKTVTTLDLSRHYPDKTTPLEVQAFRLGPDLALVTLPGEVFVELGLAIKRGSPFKTTLVIELANDIPAYVPTRKAFDEGSYEVVNSRVAPGGGEQLVEAALDLLRQLAKP